MNNIDYNKLDMIQLVNKVEDKAGEFSTHEDLSVQAFAADIKLAAAHMETRYRALKLLLFLFISMFITTVAVSIFLYYDNAKIKSLNDQLLRSSVPTDFDSIRDQIILDSAGKIIYREDNSGKPISYMTLMRENEKLKDSLQTSQFLLNFAKETFKITFTQKKIGSNTNYTVKSKVVDDLYDTIEEATKEIDKKSKSNAKAPDSIGQIVNKPKK